MGAIGRFERSQDSRFDHNLMPQFMLQAVSAWFAVVSLGENSNPSSTLGATGEGCAGAAWSSLGGSRMSYSTLRCEHSLLPRARVRAGGWIRLTWSTRRS